MNRSRQLRKARKTRIATSHFFERLESGEETLVGVLTGRLPRYLSGVRVWTLLVRTPKLGETGAKKVLTRAQVWPEDRLGTLSPEDRQRIVEALPPRVIDSH